MSLFDNLVRFNARHRVASHVLFWLVISMLSFTGDHYYNREDGFLISLLCDSFFVSFSVIASYFLAYFIIPKLLKSTNYYTPVLYFLIGSYIICVFSRIMVVHVLEPLVRTPPFEQESISEILTDIPKLAIHYFIQVFSPAWVFVFVKLVKDQYLVKNRAMQLEKEKSRTELHMLKAQLNPHFLFNTLNNIYSLSLINSPVTSTSIARLSEILDYILYRCNGPFVPLSAEINLMHNYIGLEKLRYDDHLQVNFRHNTDRDMEIAPLILLSLVENAFKHGAEEAINDPVIEIDLQLKEGKFHFKVANTYRKQESTHEADKIGLNNIRKQLELLYPGKYSFRISEEEHTFITRLDIDLNT